MSDFLESNKYFVLGLAGFSCPIVSSEILVIVMVTNERTVVIEEIGKDVYNSHVGMYSSS
jgi:hypothetical protein